MSDNLLDNLKKLEEETRKYLYEVQDKMRQVSEVPKAKALVGKYFKFHNGYSAKDHWWLYKRITANKDHMLKIDCFQESHIGEISFEYNVIAYAYHFDPASNGIQITAKEYFREQKKLVNKVLNRINKAQKQ